MLEKVEEFILLRPLARLSTVTPAGLPHSIPICFALSGFDTIYTLIDSKPKVSSKKFKEEKEFTSQVHGWEMVSMKMEYLAQK